MFCTARELYRDEFCICSTVTHSGTSRMSLHVFKAALDEARSSFPLGIGDTAPRILNLRFLIFVSCLFHDSIAFLPTKDARTDGSEAKTCRNLESSSGRQTEMARRLSGLEGVARREVICSVENRDYRGPVCIR